MTYLDRLTLICSGKPCCRSAPAVLELTSSLVSAAGIVENFVAHEYPTDKVKKLLDINVMGSWYCALEAAKRMPDGGSITLVGSMSGSVVNIPQPQTPYNFSSEQFMF